ncbi:peroxisomal membrane anchor protein conserved region-domain-containing protein [Lineolata rhizophorae]|uniref:Peroxisomal membrane protein PEX14 n=1 Tax=Lineolata rhizophorae TaxID=578093 RepID=A0A6A6NP50_9PEZI|nr:peroxisomal membrane anchor protein conserved region-domain-containing protein [Lineolata rhizophorae]
MVREELVNSAVSFLQDPSVAAAPLDKRISFLQSKNLTQEEINASLARAGDPSTPGAPTPSSSNTGDYAAYRQAPPPPPQGYGAYPPPPPGYWQQPPPPEVPKRDWRDWFIMATVMGGVGYGLYFTAKRYILPLISPPTPPQLESDKAALTTSLEHTTALLDQLSADIEALKSAESTRTQRLDGALADVESVLASLKDASKKREDDARRFQDELRGLRDAVPRAIEAGRESQEQRLRELGREVGGLKTLVANRLGAGNGAPGYPGVGRPLGSSYSGSFGQQQQPQQQPSSSSSSNPPSFAGVNGAAAAAAPADGQPQQQPQQQPTPPPQAAGPYSARFAGGRGAAIPAWQMAAAKKSQAQENGAEKKDTSESGTVTEATAA